MFGRSSINQNSHGLIKTRQYPSSNTKDDWNRLLVQYQNMKIDNLVKSLTVEQDSDSSSIGNPLSQTEDLALKIDVKLNLIYLYIDELFIIFLQRLINGFDNYWDGIDLGGSIFCKRAPYTQCYKIDKFARLYRIDEMKPIRILRV